jgi:hypothetical protein
MSPAFALNEYALRTGTECDVRHGEGRNSRTPLLGLRPAVSPEDDGQPEPIRLRDLRNEMHHELVAEDLRLQQLAAATLQRETVSSPMAV